jgi:DNA-binding MarR family transcriptional regulator
MSAPSELHAIRLATSMLAELLEIPSEGIDSHLHSHDGRVDSVISAGPHRIVIEYKGSGRAAPVSKAIERLRRSGSVGVEPSIPVVLVPFMGDVGRKLCSEAGVGWLDLSGNAHIFAPGLRIHVEGKPNQYKARGRPSSAFAPKSSRVARWLLMNPRDWFSQGVIADSTSMDQGFTSRILARLEEDGLVERNTSGEFRPRDPELLLDAWREVYDFSKHHVIKGHVSARSGDELLRKLSRRLTEASVRFAATGLAGAWLLDHFAGFRITTVYIEDPLADSILDSFGFRPEPRGANVWFVVPNDPEVIGSGGEQEEGGERIPCVHPVQVYLDLKGHPERAKDAAGKLRERLVADWVEGDD